MDPLNAFLERYRLSAAAEVTDELVTHKHDASEIEGPFGNVIVTGDIWSSNWDGAIPADLSVVDAAATVGFYLDSSEGAAQFQLLYAGDLTLADGDMYSADWDGAIPADLSGGPDDTATAGFYLSGTDGAAQFQAAYAQGGELHDLDITGALDFVTGGKLRTDTSGQRIEVATIHKDRIKFYSGFGSETAPGWIETGNIAGEAALKVVSPTTDGCPSWIKMSDEEIRLSVGCVAVFRFLETGVDFLIPIGLDDLIDVDFVGTAGTVYPSIVQYETSSTDVAATTQTITLPAGMRTGNLCFVCLSVKGNSIVVAWPDGWTSDANPDSAYGQYAGWRVVTGNEETTISVTLTQDSVPIACRGAAVALEIRDFFDVVSVPPWGSAYSNYGWDKNPDSPSLTVGTGSKWLWITHASAAGSTVSAWPANYAHIQVEKQVTSGPTLMVAGRQTAGSAPVSENPGSFTMADSVVWQASTWAIRGAATDAGIADQSVLVYQLDSNRWENRALVLGLISDVNAAAPNDGDVLTWSAGTGKWIPVAP